MPVYRVTYDIKNVNNVLRTQVDVPANNPDDAIEDGKNAAFMQIRYVCRTASSDSGIPREMPIDTKLQLRSVVRVAAMPGAQ